jgi:hypothetical protein
MDKNLKKDIKKTFYKMGNILFFFAAIQWLIVVVLAVTAKSYVWIILAGLFAVTCAALSWEFANTNPEETNGKERKSS